MPGLRSLVARRRSTLASPQYSCTSRTPPPSTSSSVFQYAHKVERRCNSLPGQVSLDAYEAPENSQLLRPYVSGIGFFNGSSNGTFVGGPAQRIDSDQQNHEVNTSLETINSSERGGRAVFANSTGNSINISSRNNSVNNSGGKRSAMEIESSLAKRGVTVVRRMVDAGEGHESQSKNSLPFSLKDSVITANPLITKENTKLSSEDINRPSRTLSTSVPPGYSNLPEEGKLKYADVHKHHVLNTSREIHKQLQKSLPNDKIGKTATDPYKDKGPPQSQSAYDSNVCISQHSSAQPGARVCDSVCSTRTLGLIGHPYSNQLLSHQQNVKDPGVAERNSPSNSSDVHGYKESSLLSSAQGLLKRNLNEMSAPHGSSVFLGRPVSQNSPQSKSSQQSKTVRRVSQFPETSSPLSKSSEVSPQPKSADMSPYSRSSEPSPSSRNAQMSPHSRSSQMSPMSRCVKASPHSRSSEVSPHARGQPSPLTRSDLSPKSKGVGLSPQSTSVDSPQSRSSSGPHLHQPIQQNHQPSSAVNPPTPLQPGGHTHISNTERNMAHTLPVAHHSHAHSSGSLQQGTSMGSTQAGSNFPNNPTAEYLARSVSNMFPSCNTSEILSQSNAGGFPVQMNATSFAMNANTGSFLSHGSGAAFPSSPAPPSLGYSQDGSTPSQFSGLNVSGGMGANANPMNFGNLPNCGGFPLHEITGLYGSHPNAGIYNATEALNYVASRDFTMHTPYRDFPSYSSSSHGPNHMRSQELSVHSQREVLSNPNSREPHLQNCNQAMSAHHSVRDSSLNSIGREGHLQNYGEQQLQPGYRSSLYQRINSEILPLVDNRNSSLRQNYRETAAYKSNPLSSSYRESHESVKSTPTPPYRDPSVLSNTSDYQSSPNPRSSNILTGYREQSVLTTYREQVVLSNYLGSGNQINTNFKEPNVLSNNRDQMASSYRDVVNQTSSIEHPAPIPPYQDVMSTSDTRGAVRSNYSEAAVNHSPNETISSQYRESMNHPSPADHAQAFRESVSHDNRRDVLPGFHNIQSPPTGTNDHEVPPKYRDNVSHTSPRDQSLHSFQHSTILHSPRQQQHSIPYKENQAVPSVEQRISAYEGNLNHSSPAGDQQCYPGMQKNPREGHPGYLGQDYSSPGEGLSAYREEVVTQGSPRKSLLQGYRSTDSNQQVMTGCRESMNCGGMDDSLSGCSSSESIVRRSSREYGPGYSASMANTPLHEDVGVSGFGDVEGLQNFRVHRSPNEFTAAPCETKTAVLPSFTESFENASHSNVCMNKSSMYKEERENAYYGVNCEKYCEVPSEKLQSCPVESPSVYESLENEAKKEEVDCSTKYQEESENISGKTLLYANEEDPYSFAESEKTQDHLASEKSTGDTHHTVPSGEDRRTSTESSCSSVASRDSTGRSASKSHGLSPEMISNHKDQPVDCCEVEQRGETFKPMESSPIVAGSSDESPEKGDQAEILGKSNAVSSPTSQERIVIKMKLLHSKPPGNEGHFHNGKYGGGEAESDSGNSLRYPGAKYTRWTIDSIINGRERGGAQVLSPGTIKMEEDEEDHHHSDSQSSEKSNRRRKSNSPTSSKPTKFDTNKNLKSLKITIQNPFVTARATSEESEAKSVLKSDNKDSGVKQEPIDSYNASTSDVKIGQNKREGSLLRNIRKYGDGSSSTNLSSVESGLSSSSVSQNKRSGRKHNDSVEKLLLKSEDSSERLCYPALKIKPCSIVIKRIYAGDNYSCYSSSLCDKDTVRRRPKRKAAIEANERRHKSLRSFDHSLELFSSIHSEKVPYNGPMTNKYKTLLPVIVHPPPLTPVKKEQPTPVKKEQPTPVKKEQPTPVKKEQEDKPLHQQSSLPPSSSSSSSEHQSPPTSTQHQVQQQSHSSSISQKQQLTSPVKGASQKQQLSSPVKGPSQKQQLSSPVKGASQKQQISSPVKEVSYKQKLSSPVKEVSYKQKLSSPVKGASQKQQISSPVKGASQKQQISSPVKEVSYKQKLSSPVKGASQKQQLSSVKEVSYKQKLSSPVKEVSQKQLSSPVKEMVKNQPVMENQNSLPPCSVLVCDIFMNRKISTMFCPGCSRHYGSSDTVQVNLSKMEMSLVCYQCSWEVVKNIKPHQVEAMEPR